MPASAVLPAPAGAGSGAGAGGDRGAGKALAPGKPPRAHLPEGQHGHLQPLPVLAQAAGTSWGCGSSQGDASAAAVASPWREDGRCFSTGKSQYKPHQQIHVLEVLAVAEVNLLVMTAWFTFLP